MGDVRLPAAQEKALARADRHRSEVAKGDPEERVFLPERCDTRRPVSRPRARYANVHLSASKSALSGSSRPSRKVTTRSKSGKRNSFDANPESTEKKLAAPPGPSLVLEPLDVDSAPGQTAPRTESRRAAKRARRDEETPSSTWSKV